MIFARRRAARHAGSHSSIGQPSVGGAGRVLKGHARSGHHCRGSVRRGTDTAETSDIVAAGADRSLTDAFVDIRVERVLGTAAKATSVTRRLQGRSTLRHDRATRCVQYSPARSTTRAARQIVERGWKLNAYGMFDPTTSVDGAKEEYITRLSAIVDSPELRENRGELDAASAGTMKA